MREQVHEAKKPYTYQLEYAEERGWPSWQHLQKIELGKKNITYLTLKRPEDLYEVKLIHI